jgi:formylglycine-generating enzyme required for sulfatase activity
VFKPKTHGHLRKLGAKFSPKRKNMKTRTEWIKLGLGALALGVGVAAQAAAPVIQSIEMVGANPRLGIQSDVGSTNQIQYSTNLGQTNWTGLTNLVVTASPYWFVDVAAPPAPFRFYRVIALEPINNLAPTNMALTPAGSFTMGDNLDGESDAVPLHTVYVSAFYMDKYDVTKALWDSVYQWATNNGYSFDNAGSGKAANHPVQTIGWYDSVKWCNARSEMEGRTPAYYTSAAQTTVYRTGQLAVDNSWVKWNSGYRLPTEAEWEKAARGGASGHRFPWSDTDNITHSRANYYSTTSYAYDVSPTRGFHPTFATGGYPYTSPVGSFAPNGYGLYDMAGNVWQWCWDWYGDYSSASQTDPRGPTSGQYGYRVNRGGSWDNNAFGCRTAYRGYYDPSVRYNNMGFRSVLPPGQ